MPQPFSRTTRSLDADTATRWTRWIAAALVLLVPWAWWAALVPVPVYVLAPATVTGGSFPVQSSVDGRLVSRSVALGDAVVEGDVLFELNAEPTWLELEAMESEISALQPEIVAIEAQLSAADAAVQAATREAATALAVAQAERDAAAAEADRAEQAAEAGARLREAGAIGAEELRALQADATIARSRLAATQSALSGLRASASSRLGVLEGERHAIAAQLAARKGAQDVGRSRIARLEEEVELRRVRAPISGRVGAVTALEPGATLRAGEVLATLVSMHGFEVRAEVAAAEAVGRVFPNQKGRLKLDALPWLRYGALPVVVREVGNTPLTRGVQIEAEIGESDLPLQEGLTGSLEIEVERLTPAMLVLRTVGAAGAR